MAMNDNPYSSWTTDQLLQALKSGQMGNGMVSNAYTSGMAGGQDGYSGPTGTQYGVFDGQSYHPGQMNYAYDDKGGYLGSHASSKDNNLRNFALSVLAMVGGAAALGGAGSAGAGATLGEGWAGGAAGAGGMGAGGAAGGAAAGAANGAWDVLPDAVGGAPNTAAMGASGGGFGSGDALSKAALDGTTSFGANSAPGAIDVGAGAYGTSVIPSVTVNAAAGTSGALTGGGSGGMFDGLLSGGAGSLLGPAASILGAIAGGKGQKTTETSTKSLPPEMQPFVYGQGGLLPSAMGLFQQQTAPGAMPGYQAMQNAGMGLLQQPMAGNGFAQFQQRPRFGG